MALEVATDGKNDKTEQNDQEYVYNKRTRDGTSVLFCVPPSFVLIDNKHILSCAIIRSKQLVERKQRRTENETVVFISSQFFSIFQDYAINAEIIWSYYRLCSEDQNKKNVQLDWQETDNVDTGCGWSTWVTRWRGGESGAQGQTSAIGNWQSCCWTSKRKGSWYFFFDSQEQSTGTIRLNNLLSTTSLRKCVFLACYRPVGFFFSFHYYYSCSSIESIH